MAKSNITEADLAAGMASMGGLGSFGQKPKRDSPFGPDFVKKAAPIAAPAVSVPVQVQPVQSAPVTLSTPAPVESVPSPIAKEKVPEIAVRTIAPKATAPKKEIEVDEPKPTEGQGSEAFTERITLQMTPDMRDTLSDMARTLQRGRRDKGERLTSNTLMRVAIQHFIDTADMKNLTGASSEDELLKEVGKKKGR